MDYGKSVQRIPNRDESTAYDLQMPYQVTNQVDPTRQYCAIAQE